MKRDEAITRINDIIEALRVLGWTKEKLAMHLGFAKNAFSPSAVKHATDRHVQGMLAKVERFNRQPVEAPARAQLIAPPPKEEPRKPINNGVLDELTYANRLTTELEAALTRAAGKALPLLEPGLRKAIEQTKQLQRSIRVG